MRPTQSKWGPILAAVGVVGMAAYLFRDRDAPPAVPEARPTAELVEQLRDPDVQARREAAAGLAKLGPGALIALGPLIETLADRNALVRAEAAVALGRIGP